LASDPTPSAHATKFFIDEPPDGSAAIRINRFTHEQAESGEQLPQLIDKGMKS
jgi:hypothetical protein